MKKLIFVLLVTCATLTQAQKFKKLDVSPMDRVFYPISNRVSDKAIIITYSRPQLKGRQLEELVPLNKVLKAAQDRWFMKIKIAFFKGDKKTLLHRFIRWYTESPYSHAELIMPDGEQWVGISPFLTSRVGIREKRISLESQKQNWDYLTFSLNWRPPVREYQINQLNKFIQKTFIRPFVGKNEFKQFP